MCLDVCESDMVTVDDLFPENVWILQPLDASCKCLPLARIVIEMDCGTIITKASVKPAEVSEGYYLMGNATAKLIEEKREQSARPLNFIGMESRPQKEQYTKNECIGRDPNYKNSPSPSNGVENNSIKLWRVEKNDRISEEKPIVTERMSLSHEKKKNTVKVTPLNKNIVFLLVSRKK